jgi:hypothetical protein
MNVFQTEIAAPPMMTAGRARSSISSKRLKNKLQVINPRKLIFSFFKNIFEF